MTVEERGVGKLKIYVTIRGPVSAMKSPTAQLIARAIAKVRPDLSCMVFDHELFAVDMRGHLADGLRSMAKESHHNVCVIVIGTGTAREPLTITIEPALPGASVIFNAVTDYLGELRSEA
jgi:hypothetical protein